MCLALGYIHPDRLLDDLSAEQISEWEAFNRIQPIGARRFDVYFSFIMATIHNIAIGFSGSKTAKQYKPEDFVPNWTGVKEEEVVMSAADMKQFWIAFADKHNKEYLEKQTRKGDKQ